MSQIDKRRRQKSRRRRAAGAESRARVRAMQAYLLMSVYRDLGIS
jgi:hypothetical protein